MDGLIPYRHRSHHKPTQFIQSNQQKGFTLLEILVAMVMMGLVVGTLLQVFGTSLHGLALAEEYGAAVQVAESQLQAIGKAIPVEPGRVTGQMEGTPYTWTVELEPVELLADPDTFSLSVQPFQAIVRVQWDSGGKAREFSLSSLRFGATP